MGTLEKLLIATICINIVVTIAFFACWILQVKINRLTQSVLQDILNAWIKYDKAVDELSSSVSEAYLKLAWEIDKAKEELEKDNKAAVFAVWLWNAVLDFSKIKDVCDDNCKSKGRRAKAEWTEGDRPCRKHARRSNAA